MNEDILLGPEQINKALDDGYKAYCKDLADGHGKYNRYEDYQYDELCRAQVREVAKQMDRFFTTVQLTSHNDTEPPPSMDDLIGEFRKILRAAGEGK